MGYPITKFEETAILEKKSARLECRLLDDTGAGLAAASLTACTLTLYDRASLALINPSGRPAAQNILNTNGCTIDTAGNLVLQLDPADNALADTTKERETHVALIEWSWQAGARKGGHEFHLLVAGSPKIT